MPKNSDLVEMKRAARRKNLRRGAKPLNKSNERVRFANRIRAVVGTWGRSRVEIFSRADYIWRGGVALLAAWITKTANQDALIEFIIRHFRFLTSAAAALIESTFVIFTDGGGDGGHVSDEKLVNNLSRIVWAGGRRDAFDRVATDSPFSTRTNYLTRYIV